MVKHQSYLKNRYISYRRYCLNQLLEQHQLLMRGIVVDLGGKYKRSKFFFQPPETKAMLWIYVNIDPKSEPRTIANVVNVPLTSSLADCVICTEEGWTRKSWLRVGYERVTFARNQVTVEGE